MSLDSHDRRFMTEAIALARQGLYSTSPNPRVGCLMVRNGEVVGQGFHRRAGGPHAEIEALGQAGLRATGATVYVTLEPCSHFGRTAPCADALIAAGVERVVMATVDPNPVVAGSGEQRLRQAGIRVETGLLEAEARALNPGFFKRMQNGLPWVSCKLAMSLDGRTAMASGESKWITGDAARADVQRLRARSCAVLSGIDSVLQDDSRLDVRESEIDGLEVGRQPLRVIVDSRLRLSATAKLFGAAGDIVVATATQDAASAAALRAAGANIVCLPGEDGRVDLVALLRYLADAQCNEVLIEAGATLAGAAVRAGLVDELIVYMAPVLLGSAARPLLDLPLSSMAQSLRLTISEVSAVGDDWRITARPVRGNQ